MISILPPEIKKQIAYSQRNVVARRYLIILGLIALITGSALFVIHRYADQQIAGYEASLQEVNEKTKQYQELEDSVNMLNEQTQTVKTLLDQRPQFSILLTDLAQVLPSGSYLNGISLSQETDKPLELLITVPSRNQAVQLKKALLQSPRIGAADIQSINKSTTSSEVNVSVVIAFDTETKKSDGNTDNQESGS